MAGYISNKTIEKLKHDLVRNGLVNLEDLNRAEELCARDKKNLAQALTEEKFISEEALLEFIQDNLHIPYVNLEDYSIDEKCTKFISAEDAEKYKIIPLFRIENTLTVAMADPLDLFALNNLVKCLNCRVEPVICSERLILREIEKYYSREKPFTEREKVNWTEETGEENLVKAVIAQALEENATEIILEDVNVKFRKAGIIEEKGVVPRLLVPLVISHLKNLSGLDVNVFDVPQLGKFRCRDITAVISTFPYTGGERITVKFYKPPKNIKELKININPGKPGIILIAGPEQSGKSFVAYSILNSMDKDKKNIMTIESIAKYDLKGVTQCELREKAGFNIEKALKFIDFQSPDVIYFEEIPIAELLKTANSNRVIITEISEDSITEELKKSINYLIIVRNVDEITVET